MITEPAEMIGIDRVHILNYIKPLDKGDNLEVRRQDLYKMAYSAAYENFDKLCEEIKEHKDVETYNFDACFHAIYDILIEETRRHSAVYVNISGGTPEYAAAAAIASMMVPEVNLFSVGVPRDGHTMVLEDMIDSMKYEGKFVGTAIKINDPYPINKFPLDPPKLEPLKALKVFREVPEYSRSNVNIIRELIKHRLWKFGVSDDNPMMGTSLELEDAYNNVSSENWNEHARRQRKEAVQYQKAFIDVWKDEKWIEKSEINAKRYRLTDKGNRFVDIFCSDIVFSLNND
ncbi:hypothetical protein EOM86_02735 [Candidatus Nomurabacteria bacterium]|nr:hypothetical protein [Candidatus Nomurabacteria bacterium]